MHDTPDPPPPVSPASAPDDAYELPPHWFEHWSAELWLAAAMVAVPAALAALVAWLK